MTPTSRLANLNRWWQSRPTSPTEPDQPPSPTSPAEPETLEEALAEAAAEAVAEEAEEAYNVVPLDRRIVPVSSAGTSSPARTRWIASDGAWETTLRGRQVINDSRLFRGVAFNEQERRDLGLVGLLPPQVIPLHEQLTRALGQYYAQPTDLAKNVYLSLLQDRNEVLFFRLLSEHLPEMLPVVYTPTVGEAIQHYSHEYRRPRGVFLSVDHPDDIEIRSRRPGSALTTST